MTATALQQCCDIVWNNYYGVVPKERKQRVLLATVLLASPFSDRKVPNVQKTMIRQFKLHVYGKRWIQVENFAK